MLDRKTQDALIVEVEAEQYCSFPVSFNDVSAECDPLSARTYDAEGRCCAARFAALKWMGQAQEIAFAPANPEVDRLVAFIGTSLSTAPSPDRHA